MSMSGTLGVYIRNCREQRGLTQTELAERADVPRTTVNRIETGTTQLPSPDVRRRLARVLGVPHLDLLVAAGEVTKAEAAGVIQRDPTTPVEQVCELVRGMTPEEFTAVNVFVAFVVSSRTTTREPVAMLREYRR
jgi:XRE family transcriptional regulator of biofilm formation